MSGYRLLQRCNAADEKFRAALFNYWLHLKKTNIASVSDIKQYSIVFYYVNRSSVEYLYSLVKVTAHIQKFALKFCLSCDICVDL